MTMRSDRLRSRRARLGRREAELRRAGFRRIAGADEAGAGPLAGPLIAAAVILPSGARLPEVNDSKQLSPEARERCAALIRAAALAFAVDEASVAEIEQLGPYRGALLALTRAVQALEPAADYLLVDARRLPDLRLPQEAVVGGDARHLSIAAASILAKTHRDALMVAWDREYPGYGFAQHKGYGTAEHLAALQKLGPCPLHRRTYAPVKRVVERQGELGF